MNILRTEPLRPGGPLQPRQIPVLRLPCGDAVWGLTGRLNSDNLEAMNAARNRVYLVLGPVLAVAALILYSITLSRAAFPGQSADLMASELGLSPLAFSRSPLWHWVVTLISWLPLGTMALRLNFLSALCGAGSVWLLFRITTDAVWNGIPVNDENARAANQASLAAGLVAAIALMGCIPFWYAATRFHVALFDLLLLLSLARLLLRFMRDAAVWAGLLLAFCYGVFAAEFATLIVFAPLALAGTLYGLWNNGDLRWRRVMAIAGCLAAGMLFYGWSAWNLANSELMRFSGDAGFWTSLFYVLKGQYQLIAKSLPQVGWLVVVVVGIAPWLAVLAIWRRGLNEERDWGLYSLHLVLTGVVLAVLFNVPFSPWRMLGQYRLLVTPYALLAFTLGYLAAYWSLISRVIVTHVDEDDTRRLWWRAYGGWIPAGLVLVAAVTAGVLNFGRAEARTSSALQAYARSVVRTAADRQWLVTDGTMDSLLLLAAREEGRDIRIFNLRMGNNASYMKYVARQFDNPRLQGFAAVDGMAFLQEWMRTEKPFADKVAFITHPDFWLMAGLQPVPECVLFGGGPEGKMDYKTLWARHEAFWKEPFIAQLPALRQNELLAWHADTVLRRLSMIANNVGVLMEDGGLQDEAARAYRKARELDPDNISAILNLVSLARRGYAMPDAAAVERDFEKMVEGLKQKLHIWSLSRVYGYVRMPEAYANLGLAWAYSGQPALAAAGYKRAMDLAVSGKDRLSQGLAMAYVAQDQAGAGEELLRGVLADNPTNVQAMVALSRLAVRGGKIQEAGELLDKVLATGVRREHLAMEYAVLHLAAGNPDRARVVLQELTDLKPDLAAAWAMLSGVGIEQEDTALIKECERRLQRVKGKDFLATAALGQIALYRRDYPAARIYLEQALAMRPAATALLDMLLRLDVAEGQKDQAADHVRRILLVDSGHAFANQVLATLQLERKEYAQAESSLRKSLERGRTPVLLNDLAWVLCIRGQLDEAETLAREAVAKMERDYNFKDTLGVILLRRGKLAEAEAVLNQALTLAPDTALVQLHLAELNAAKGNTKKAAEMAESLMGRLSTLSRDDQEKVRALSRGK